MMGGPGWTPPPGPGRTWSSWARMRTHPVVGADIVAPIRFLGDAVDVIRFHHERFDGSGYPDGLSGEEIPLSARIFAVADAFDAMTSDRPYRHALPLEESVERIEGGAGSQFDPVCVDAFVDLVAEDDGFVLPRSRAIPSFAAS